MNCAYSIVKKIKTYIQKFAICNWSHAPNLKKNTTKNIDKAKRPSKYIYSIGLEVIHAVLLLKETFPFLKINI